MNVGSLVDVTGREIGKNIGSLGHAISLKRDGQAPAGDPPPSLERVLSETWQGDGVSKVGRQTRSLNPIASYVPRDCFYCFVKLA